MDLTRCISAGLSANGTDNRIVVTKRLRAPHPERNTARRGVAKPNGYVDRRWALDTPAQDPLDEKSVQFVRVTERRHGQILLQKESV